MARTVADNMIYVWVELGAYSNLIICQQNNQREISAKVWRNITHDADPKLWGWILREGYDRYCPITNQWSCGFWRPI